MKFKNVLNADGRDRLFCCATGLLYDAAPTDRFHLMFCLDLNNFSVWLFSSSPFVALWSPTVCCRWLSFWIDLFLKKTTASGAAHPGAKLGTGRSNRNDDSGGLFFHFLLINCYPINAPLGKTSFHLLYLAFVAMTPKSVWGFVVNRNRPYFHLIPIIRAPSLNCLCMPLSICFCFW